MTVTKRVRFEVLRRDNHACRYCGATAPEAKLTVDHVVPVALGGTDLPSNLVAACRDCNAGKTSTSPDEHIVDDVNENAIRMKDLFSAAMQDEVSQIEELHDYREMFTEHLVDNGWKHYPDCWKSTVDQWCRLGIPMEIVAYAVEIATDKNTVRGYEAKWKYACGIIWKKAQGATEKLVGSDGVCQGYGNFVQIEDVNSGDGVKKLCRECEVINAWHVGYDVGQRAVMDQCVRNSGILPGWDLLAFVIDNRGRRNE